MTGSGDTGVQVGIPGRRGVIFAALWLVFLAEPISVAWAERDQLSGWVGILSTVGFGVVYVWVWTWLRSHRRALVVRPALRDSMPRLALLIALAVVMCLSIGQPGTAAAVYVAVTGVMFLRVRAAAAFSLVIAAVVGLLGETVPGWDRALGLSFAVCAGSFAMFGVQQLMLRNIELIGAREENARLAVEDERNRFARDLHDILGHSLTVITVKAELAARLFEVDQDRARAELSDLERLSRDALSDVRRAVEGYRELTLPGELARAREALLAAGIEPHLPNSADDVPTELRDLFAWTVREGVTNVIRHSAATECTVRMTRDHVEIRDNGTGPIDVPHQGFGLAGLRERADAADAVLLTDTLQPNGFMLEVSVR